MAGFPLNPIQIATVGASVGLTVIHRMIQSIKSENGSSSLSKVASIARVEPITVVEKRLIQHENIIDILETSLNIYSCIYMQAVALTNTSIGNIQTITRLGALNGKGDKAIIRNIIGKAIGIENVSENAETTGVVSEIIDEELEENLYKDSLPTSESYKNLSSSLEAKVIKVPKGTVIQNPNAININKTNNDLTTTSARDVIKDATNLVVGKVLEVKIKEGSDEITIPVSISLATIEATSNVISNVLTTAINKNESFDERMMGWSSGRLSFIKDILFGQDIIRKHRKTLIQDKNGVFTKLQEGKKNARSFALATGKTSLAAVSNVVIVERLTIDRLEAETGYQLDNYKQRSDLLNATGIMLLVVVDEEAGVCSFYIDGITAVNTVPIRALKSSNKKNSTDITDIFRAIVRADQPRL